MILFASLKYFPCSGYPYQWQWQDLEDHQKSGPDGEITTSFEYDGIQRLVRVTDTEGNVTTSTYDMGDRRTEVNHPASGITSFTYDALGNVLTKQTANLAKEGKFITYDYDYQRLTGINYPDHPEILLRWSQRLSEPYR